MNQQGADLHPVFNKYRDGGAAGGRGRGGTRSRGAPTRARGGIAGALGEAGCNATDENDV